MATPIFEFAVCFAIGASNHFLCELMTDMPETFASRMEVADLGSILVSSSRSRCSILLRSWSLRQRGAVHLVGVAIDAYFK